MANPAQDLRDLAAQLDEVANGEYDGEVLIDDPDIKEWLSWAKSGLERSIDKLKAAQ
jgi:hypothetical protein